MAHQGVYGGAPRIGNSTEGEPISPGGDVSSFGGAPTVSQVPSLNKGNKQLNRQPGPVYPDMYGGAPPIGKAQSNDVPGGSGSDTAKNSGAVIP